MEYQRVEEKEKRKKRKRTPKIQTVDSIAISMMDEDENPKTRWEVLVGIVSRLKVPGLKTLGRKNVI